MCIIRKKFVNRYCLKRFASCEGSYTVEAALVMPFVLGVILLVLYLAIYTHDKVVMEYAILKVCAFCKEYINSEKSDGLNGINSSGGISWLEAYSEEIMDAEIERGTIGRWEKQVNISIEEGSLKVNIEGRMGNSQGLLNNILSGRIFVVNISNSVKLVNEYEWIISK